jgi:hypothetical protein
MIDKKTDCGFRYIVVYAVLMCFFLALINLLSRVEEVERKRYDEKIKAIEKEIRLIKTDIDILENGFDYYDGSAEEETEVSDF